MQRHGALAEVITVPWQKVVLASQRSLRELALVEPLTIGFHAVQRGEVTARDTVVVLGRGTIGLGVIAGAVRRGAEVVGVDLYDWKLDLARTIRAEHTVNTDSHSLSDRLRAITDGEGPAVIVEAIGRPETFRAAVDEVAFGGRVVYLGYVGESVTYDPTPFVKKELDIRGSRNACADDFEVVIDYLKTGSFPVDPMITRTVGVEDAGRALRDWRDHPQDITKIHVSVQLLGRDLSPAHTSLIPSANIRCARFPTTDRFPLVCSGHQRDVGPTRVQLCDCPQDNNVPLDPCRVCGASVGLASPSRSFVPTARAASCSSRRIPLAPLGSTQNTSSTRLTCRPSSTASGASVRSPTQGHSTTTVGRRCGPARNRRPTRSWPTTYERP